MKWTRYWPEITIFASVLGLLLIDTVPALSWMQVNSDVGANILAAKYFYPEHGSGEPLNVILGHLFLYIPIGSDSWRMGLMSTLSTLGAMVFVYLTVYELLKANSKKRLYAIAASLVFAGAMLVVSQSGIVQLYALITLLSLGAFYFTVKKKWVLAAIMIGIGLAVHHLILITWLVLLVSHKELRHWKPIIVSLSFLTLYAYQPITKYIVGAPDNWVNTSLVDFFRSNLSTVNMLVGTLSIYDLPARLMNTLGVVTISLGLGVVALIWWIWKTKQWKHELLWLFILPIVYVITDLVPDVTKYSEPAIGFGAIIVGLGLAKLNMKWVLATTTVAIALLGFNVWYFDIGNTLDRNLSAQKFYDEELVKIPDGDIFMTNSAWQWQLALLYNREKKSIVILSTEDWSGHIYAMTYLTTNRHIIPICIGTLTGEPYLQQLENQGVKLERNYSKDSNERQGLIAQSILRLNPNVWMDVPTEPSTYGAKVIKGDNGQVAALLTHSGMTTKTSVNWKPMNPYDVVTGARQVEEWQFLTYSNWNMRLVIGLLSVGLILNWAMWRRTETKSVVKKV